MARYAVNDDAPRPGTPSASGTFAAHDLLQRLDAVAGIS
jgi:hypothetical protein